MDNVVLWVDDLRDPEEPQWKDYIRNRFKCDCPVIWIKSYDEFVSYLGQARPLPMYISLDHDLGKNADGSEKSGFDCAKHLVDIMLDYQCRAMPDINVHSANPVGKENIETLISNLRKHMSSTDDF